MPPTETTATVDLGHKVTLSNLLNGRLETLFSHYISAILQSIKDPDTSPQSSRRIKLELELEPQHGRDYALATISMQCTCLQHIKPMKAGFFMAGSADNPQIEEQPTEEENDPLHRASNTAHAISLSSLVNGAVDEAFQDELLEVVRNIRDVNKEQSAKRKLTVLFTFAASEARNYAGIRVAVGSSCTGHNSPLMSSLIISITEGGVITAREQYIEQGRLFE